jgi:tRNA 5-methylaminomethyl-2-thiouridine biosynthesis bifunctional protein
MIIKSEQFDDVYFSADGGLAETSHVFLAGNKLPQAWQGVANYTIAETGFGTGLNFLATWKLFEETSNSDQKLHFISIEKYPLSALKIKEALGQWAKDLNPFLDQLLHCYPIRVPGAHDIDLTDRVRLTLWIGDVHNVLPEWTGQIDAWFLDGFTPSKNPDMWDNTVFETMARLAHAETSYATFTAARMVRDGLANANFTVDKMKGFGRKRDMIQGRYTKNAHRQPISGKKKVAIIGGGLAGCAAAWQFRKHGHDVSLYEASDNLASGASGGKLGMINPKLTAKPTPHSEYYTACYANALRDLSTLNGIDLQIHGSLHLQTDDDKKRRFAGYVDNLGWHKDHIQWQGNDLYYPDGATVSPYKLCHALIAKDVAVNLNHKICDVSEIDADIIILANGPAINEFSPDLNIGSVRGQVSWIKSKAKNKTNICFGGYITPETKDGFRVLGSSFEPWNTSTDVTDENHQSNIERYNQFMNDELSMNDVVGGWAALRASSKDRFPMVGHVQDNIYVSCAHGSHGIISSLMSARILRSIVDCSMIPLSRAGLKALCPKRAHKR